MAVISNRAQLWLRLAMLRGIGPMLGRRLVAEFTDIEAFWAADAVRLKEIDGIGPRLLSIILHSDGKGIDAVVESCEEKEIRILCPDDSDWPASLVGLDELPLILFIKGDVHPLHQARVLSVVGARRASREGQVIARRWCRFFSDRSVNIVSGMAYGIDAAAHRGALEGDSATVAVLGCGLAALSEEQQLQVAAICRKGCVVSEFLPGVTARPEYFPRRNRIIAALSSATLVVEADLRSGSLITARQAIEFGRELFAVPGSVLAGNHEGCHQLIRDGAVLAANPEQLLQHMGWQAATAGLKGRKKTYVPADALEAKVLSALAQEGMHLDGLCETCGLTLPELSPILLALELQGVIERLPGSRYMLSVELPEI